MPLVDTHVHLNFDSLAQDLEAVSAAWREAGVSQLVHSCVEPGEFAAIQAIADRCPEVYLSVGLHPLDMDKWTPDSSNQIRHLAQSDRRVVAIGETGLDFYKADDAEIQRRAFWAQLAIAHQLGLPVIVHCRDAAAETAKLVGQFQQTVGPVQGVMHCWAGSPEETQWFLDLGFYISFSGIVTFKNAKQVKASARIVPEDRLLVETDCPFLSPEPCRKDRRNQPAYVHYVATYLAELRQVDYGHLSQITTRNARRLFKLPEDGVSDRYNQFKLPSPASS
jgi:TatD DNase family protein